MEKPWPVKKWQSAGSLAVALLFCLLAFPTCQPKTTKMENRISVKGRLHDAAGRPIKDAIVMIAEGSHPHQDIASVTNDSGEFYLSNVAVPGHYTLLIRTDRGSVEKEVHLQGSEEIQITY